MRFFYVIQRIPSIQHLFYVGAFLACYLASFQVSAQVSPGKSGFSYINMPDGRTVVHAGGTVVRTLPAIATPPVGAAVVSRGMGISSAAGSITAAGRIPVSVANASPLVVDVVAKIPKGPAAKLLSKGLRMVPVLGQGLMLYDLLNEIDFGATKGEDGSIQYTKKRSVVETQCHTELHTTCQLYASVNLYGPGLTCTYDISGGMCRQIMHFANGGSDIADQWSPDTSQGVQTVPATEQEFESAIESHDWQPNSKISGALRDASDLTGEPIPLDDGPTVTGPATSPPVSSTTQNSDGTKSVTTTTANHTYQGDTINTTTVTTTNNYDSHDVIIDSTTTTTTPPPADKPSDCEANPDSNACRQDEFDTPDEPIPKKTVDVGYQPENLFGSGSCPADKVMTVHTGQVLKVWDWANACDSITTYFRPILLIICGFTALGILIPRTDT